MRLRTTCFILMCLTQFTSAQDRVAFPNDPYSPTYILLQDTRLDPVPVDDEVTLRTVAAINNLSDKKSEMRGLEKGTTVQILDRASGVKLDGKTIDNLLHDRFEKIEIVRTGKIEWYKVSVRDGKQKAKIGWVLRSRLGKVFEVRLRAFMPCQVVGSPIPVPLSWSFPTTIMPLPMFDQIFPALGGDNRDFSYDQGTHRAGQNLNVSFGRSPGVTESIGVGQREWGESSAYYALQTEHVYGKPPWWHKLRSRAEPAMSVATLMVTNDNNRLERTADSDGERITIRLFLKGVVPLVRFAPQLDADLVVQLTRKDKNDESVDYKVLGTHDGFPSYELYINAKRVYDYDVGKSALGPLHLFSLKPVNVTKAGRVGS